MFRLPVCPHCGTVYHYKDTKSALRNKQNECYHCKKQFRARIFPYILIGAVIPLALCILLNVFLLSRMESLQLVPLFAVTLSAMLIVYLIIPFFTKFKKTEEKQNNSKKQ